MSVNVISTFNAHNRKYRERGWLCVKIHRERQTKGSRGDQIDIVRRGRRQLRAVLDSEVRGPDREVARALRVAFVVRRPRKGNIITKRHAQGIEIGRRGVSLLEDDRHANPTRSPESRGIQLNIEAQHFIGLLVAGQGTAGYFADRRNK